MTRPGTRRTVRALVCATALPVAALVLQSLLWTKLSPFAWSLFYPAVLLSSVLAGFWSGLGATALSTLLVWWRFLPPEGSLLVDEPNYVISAGVFVLVGVLFSELPDRLRRAHEAVARALDETERANEKMKKALVERQLLAALVENSSDFIGIADPKGKPLYLNPAGRRMVGLPVDYPVENTRIPEYYPPDQRSFASDVIVKSMLEAGRWRGETSFRHWQTEGSIPVDDTHFMIHQPETGEIIGMGTITRDISDMKRAEETLKESEAKFSGIVSLASDAIISVDENQTLVVYNEGAERIFGWKRAEVLGRPLEVLLPERSRPVHGLQVRRFAGEPAPSRSMGDRTPIAGLRKSGEEFPAEAAISKLKVGGKNLFSVVLRDITERKRVEDQQRFLSQVASVLASTLDYEETLASVARLVIRELADCCIIDLLEEGGPVRRLVVSHRDPSMAPVASFLQRYDFDPSRPRLASAVFETRQPLLMEEVTPGYLASIAQSHEHAEALRMLAPKSLLAVPLMAHGRLLGALIFVSGSPRRYQSHDLSLALELGTRAGLAVHNAHLYWRARRATEARDEVLGIVAHDLRNPLNGIMIHAGLLRRDGPDRSPQTRAAGESIHRAAVRMNRLIQDLLDVTRIEAGQLYVERDRVAAGKLVLDAAEMQRASAASAGLEVRIDVAPELPAVVADSHRLLQVFENLIGNAMKFTPSGGRITVGAAPRNGEVLFWVENTGPSVPAEHLAHVFDRFWQARKGGQRGSGLGLSIVKGIVEAHRGRVWVESTEGRGTTFYFTVPLESGVEESRPAVVH